MLTHSVTKKQSVLVFLTLIGAFILVACSGTPMAPTPVEVAAATATSLPPTATPAVTPTLAPTAVVTPTTAPVAETPLSAEELHLAEIIATVEQVAKEHGIEVFADQTVNLPLLGGAKRAIRLGGDKVPRPPEMPTEDGDMLAGEELSLAQREAMANRGLELIVQEHPDLDLTGLLVIDPQYENEMGENVTLPELKVEIAIISNSVPSAGILASALNKALAGQVEAKFYHPEGTGIGAYYLLDEATGLSIMLAGLIDSIGTTGVNDNPLPQIETISSGIGNELLAMAGGEENADLNKIFTPGYVLFSLSGTSVGRMQLGLDRMNKNIGTDYQLDEFVIN